jgi:hypothetical protein
LIALSTRSPLHIEDDRLIPEDLRMAYKVLKNAGCVPPEIEMRKEIVTMKDLINTMDDDKERLRKIRELTFKMMKFEMMRNRPLSLQDYEHRFYEMIFDKRPADDTPKTNGS